MPTLNDTDKQLIARYLLGGMLVGGGIGAGTSLFNHFKTLNRRADKAQDTSGDDDVLYINVPKNQSGVKSAAEAQSGLGTVLAMTALPVGALGSYALVNKLYRDYRKKQLQQELDSAQQLYLQNLTQTKAANSEGSPIRASDSIYAPVSLALLTALASGYLTNKVLDRQFPSPIKPQSTRPKRLVVREVDPEQGDGMIKEQSAFDDDAYEGLLRTVLELPGAHKSGLADLVKAAAAGRTEEILRASDQDPETMFSMVKGASDNVLDVKRDFAVGWLVREPELAPVVKLAAALEYFEAAPVYCAMARTLTDEEGAEFVKLSAAICQSYRNEKYAAHCKTEVDMTKSASGFDMASLLQEALDTREGSDERDPELQLGGTTSVEPNDNKKVDIHARGAEAQKFVERNKDMIDDIFSPEKKQLEEIQAKS